MKEINITDILRIILRIISTITLIIWQYIDIQSIPLTIIIIWISLNIEIQTIINKKIIYILKIKK